MAVRVLVAVMMAVLVAAFLSAGVSSAHVSRELPPPFPSSVGVPELDDPTVVWLANDLNISRADAARRGAWQLRAEVLLEKAGPALGSRFGGIWIDEQDYGRIKVGVVGAKAADREWLDARGFRGAADVVEVPRSLSDVETAADWLWSRAVVLNQDTVAGGSSWTLAVSISPRRSTANLSVPPVAHRSEVQRAFIEEAQTRLGSALFVEEYETPPHEEACTISLPPFCDPPLRAGIAINHPNQQCTGGFPARSRSDNKLYQFTAGHCTRNFENTWWTRFANESVHDIGPVHNCIAGRGPASNCAQGYGDYAILRVDNPAGWDQGRGWVFVRTSDPNAGEDGTTRDTAYEIRDALRVGDGWRVCKSGRHGTSCGRVFRLDYGYTSDSGYTYDFLARANYCGQSGDSGSPIYAFHHAYGIHHAGSDDCTKSFQSIVNAQDGMNVDIILAP